MTYQIADRVGPGIVRRIWAQLTGCLLLAGLAASGPATNTVLLDFEGVGNRKPVESFYGGGGGGPNYGIVFGNDAAGAVDSDVVGNDGYAIAHEPSPNTTAILFGPTFVSVLAGFTDMSFQYTNFGELNITVYSGPNMTGAVLGSSIIPRTGTCQDDCGDPTGHYGVWKNFTVPFSGTAKSAGFSTTPKNEMYVDDMVITLVHLPTKPPTSAPSEPPTSAPTKPPTKPPTSVPTKPPTNAPTDPPTKSPTSSPTTRPTRFPTKSPTTMACLRKGLKGNMRCMKK
jgi:hypothetical protein